MQPLNKSGNPWPTKTGGAVEPAKAILEHSNRTNVTFHGITFRYLQFSGGREIRLSITNQVDLGMVAKRLIKAYSVDAKHMRFIDAGITLDSAAALITAMQRNGGVVVASRKSNDEPLQGTHVNDETVTTISIGRGTEKYEYMFTVDSNVEFHELIDQIKQIFHINSNHQVSLHTGWTKIESAEEFWKHHQANDDIFFKSTNPDELCITM